MFSPGIHRLALATVVCTFLLLIAGGLVTSTRSGLAVPDWPLSFGQFFPNMNGGIAFEHGHRMIAGTVSVLIAALGVWIWLREPRRYVRHLALGAAAAVVAQAVLGGLTVLYKLPNEISVAHASLAQGVFCLVIALAVTTSSAWKSATERAEALPARPSLRASVVAFAALYVQLVLGAILRHAGTMLIVHVTWAVVAAGAVLGLAGRLLSDHGDDRRLGSTGRWLIALLCLQVALGIVSVSTGRPVFFTTAHVATGAALLGTTFIATLWAHKLAAPVGA